MGVLKDILFGSAQQMPVYHGWDEVTQKYKIVGNPAELRIGILNTREEAARQYASGIPGANAVVIEDYAPKNEFLNKHIFRVYPIKIG